MDFTEWLQRQRRWNEYFRPFEEADERRFIEALIVTAHEQVERSEQSLTLPTMSDRTSVPLVTWSRIDPEKVE